MIKESIVLNHYNRLLKFYSNKGLDENNAEKYSKMRCEKLENFQSKDSYFFNLKKLIPHLCNSKQNPSILDIGCGSGEYVIVMNLLGFNAKGCDIYSDEVNIAKELAKDLGLSDQLFKLTNVGEPLPYNDGSFDLCTMFSVMEHLNNDVYVSLCSDCIRISKTGLYSLVPNRFKFVDDHTRVPFLGFIPQFLIPFFLKLLNRDYILSESGTWDVTLRSFKLHKKLSEKFSCQVKLVDDNFIYPSLDLVPKLNFVFNFGVKNLLYNLHVLMVKILYPSKENCYPYLNIFISPK